MTEIIFAIVVVAAIGLICGLILVIASKFMEVKEDTRVTEVRECLPGANCGACGFTGMEWGGCVGTGGGSYQLRNDPQMLAEITAKAEQHARRLVERLQMLS